MTGEHIDIHAAWKAVEFTSHSPAFASHPAFIAALPMLAPPRREEPAFEPLFAFDLAGSFARALHSGGAYRRVETVARAEELARSLVQAMIGDRRDADVNVFFAEEPWHVWFADVAWDRTWVVLDWDRSRIHFLAATSSD